MSKGNGSNFNPPDPAVDTLALKLDEIISYIMDSPYNTNPVILKQLIQDYVTASNDVETKEPAPADEGSEDDKK